MINKTSLIKIFLVFITTISLSFGINHSSSQSIPHEDLFYLIDSGDSIGFKKLLKDDNSDLFVEKDNQNILVYDSLRNAYFIELTADLFKKDRLKIISNIANNPNISNSRKDQLLLFLIKDSILSGIKLNVDKLLSYVSGKTTNSDIFSVIAFWYNSDITVKSLKLLKVDKEAEFILGLLNTHNDASFASIVNELKAKFPKLKAKLENNVFFKYRENAFDNISKELNFKERILASDDTGLLNDIGENKLLFAVRKNWGDTSIYLIEHSYNTQLKDSIFKRGIVHYAILHNDLPLLQTSLAHNAPANSKDTFGFSPLELAIALKNHEAIKILGPYIDFNSFDYSFNGYPIFSYCIKNDLIDCAKNLINHSSLNPGLLDKYFGQGALFYSIVVGDTELINSILRTSFDKNKHTVRSNIVEYLSKHGDKKTLDTFIKFNVDFNAKTSNGLEPLFIFIKNKSKFLPQLLSLGIINTSIRDNDFNKSPLWWSIEHNNLEAFKILVSKDELLNDNDILTKAISEPDFLHFLISNKFIDKHSTIMETNIIDYVLSNNFSFFTNNYQLFDLSPEDFNYLLNKYANHSDDIFYFLFNKSNLSDQDALNLYNLSNKSSIKWHICKKFNLYFTLDQNGDIPFFNYLKNKEDNKISYTLENSQSIPLKLSNSNGEDISVFFGILENYKLFKYLYFNLPYEKKNALLLNNNNELLYTKLIDEKLLNTQDFKTLFHYSLRHNFSTALVKILDKKILPKKFVFTSTPKFMTNDGFDFLLKSNFFSNLDEIIDFSLLIEDKDSFIKFFTKNNISHSANEKQKKRLISSLFNNNKLMNNLPYLSKNIGFINEYSEFIFDLISDKAINRFGNLQKFFSAFPDFKEPNITTILETTILDKDFDSFLLLANKNFNIDKKFTQQSDLFFKLLHSASDDIILSIVKKINPQSKDMIADFIDFSIKNRKYEFFDFILKNPNYSILISNNNLINVIKTQDIKFFDILTKNNFNFQSFNFIFLAIDYYDSFNLNKVLSKYIANKNDKITTMIDNNSILLNPLEYYSIHRIHKNEIKIISSLTEKFTLEGSINSKFSYIFKNDVQSASIEKLLSKIVNKKDFISTNELLRLALINNLDYSSIMYIKSYVDFNDEKYLFKIGNFTNVDIPTAISLHSDHRLHLLFKLFKVNNINPEVFVGLANHDNSEIVKFLILSGLNVPDNILNKTSLLINESAILLSKSEELDPWWNDYLRMTHNTKLLAIFLLSFLFVLFIGIRYYLAYRSRKRLESFSLVLDEHRIDSSWSIDRLIQEINNVKTDLQTNEPNQNDFDSFGYYKYYLDLLKTLEFKQKSKWVEEEDIDSLLDDLHTSGNVSINDEEFAAILKQIGNSETDGDYTLIDDNSVLELEALESGSLDRNTIDKKYLKIIKDKGFDIDELSDEQLNELVHTLILNESK